jgi:hypothetical protein
VDRDRAARAALAMARAPIGAEAAQARLDLGEEVGMGEVGAAAIGRA